MKRPILFLIVLAISSGSFLVAQEKTANSGKTGKSSLSSLLHACSSAAI